MIAGNIRASEEFSERIKTNQVSIKNDYPADPLITIKHHDNDRKNQANSLSIVDISNMDMDLKNLLFEATSNPSSS